MEETSNNAIIKAFYRDKTYESLPINLSETSNIQMIMDLSENGTNHLQAFKLPLTNDKFMVFSRIQLDETLLEIEIIPKKS